METISGFIFTIAALFLLALFVIISVHAAYVYPRAGRIILETGYWPAGWRIMPRGRYVFGQGEPFYWHTMLWVRIPENLPAPKFMGWMLIIFGWYVRIFAIIVACSGLGALALKLVGFTPL